MSFFKSRLKRFHDYFEKHEHQFSIAFFIGGFIFDVVASDRIDSWFMIGQQAFYLTIIQFVLTQMFFEETQPVKNLNNAWFLKRWYYDYRNSAMHFFFGSLLNLYAIFFFKSSSLIVSFIFMLSLAAILVANESSYFKGLGLSFKFALLSLCHLAFFACVVPVFIGSISATVFLFSMAIGVLPIVGLGWWIQNYRESLFESAKSQILVPMGVVLIGFLSLYFFKLIPPVPVSIPFIGVYHSVEKTPDGYKLGHEKPNWMFWRNGDQKFVAQRSDKIYVAFRVFSPTHFSDQVQMRWFWKDNSLGWILQDSIPIKIVGGREEGFRGYGVKSNYQPGEWKVQVETGDGREIGRVYFDLEISAEEPRSFDYDNM